MPLQKIQFKPGVNRDQTNYSNEGGWFECDKIRFRSGYPQKMAVAASLNEKRMTKKALIIDKTGTRLYA